MPTKKCYIRTHPHSFISVSSIADFCVTAAELKSWDTDHIPANSKMFTIWSFKKNVCQPLRYKVKSYKMHFPDSVTARKQARDSVSTDQIYIHRFACGSDSQEGDTCKKIRYSGKKTWWEKKK